MGRLLLWRGAAPQDPTMILVDTSVIVAWMDPSHAQHRVCWTAIRHWAGRDSLAVSSVTYSELAAGARTREGVDETLAGFIRVELDFPSAWRAGQAFRQHRPGKSETPVLPDFFIRGQAAVLNLPHLTNDRRRTAVWPDVDFLFPR
jgi:predicted nucleic acid-binding protein